MLTLTISTPVFSKQNKLVEWHLISFKHTCCLLSQRFSLKCVSFQRNIHWASNFNMIVLDNSTHNPDTLGTLPDIAANARPLRAWLKYRTITTHARESVADLWRNCKCFCSRESVHARVTESRAQGTGVGRDIRQSPSRVRSVFLLIYDSTLI